MNIRPATFEDIPAIQRLYRELDRHHAGLLPQVFRTLDQDARPSALIREWIENPEADYLVAEREGQVIGFLNLQQAAHPPYPMFKPHAYAMIENVVVEKARRGQGTGAALFDAALNWTKARGLTSLQVSVWSANQAARAFYLRKGFEPLMERLSFPPPKKPDSDF